MLTNKETNKSGAKTSKNIKDIAPLLAMKEIQKECCLSSSRTHASDNSKTAPIDISKTAKDCVLTKTISTPSTAKNTSVPEKSCTTQSPIHSTQEKKQTSKTKITIKFDVGFSNQIFIRGKGANLSWEKGQPLKNIKSDEWIWEFEAAFSTCEFKVLINDQVYENGANHLINGGSSILYTPSFY